MKKKKLTKQLWYGSDKVEESNVSAAPPIAVNDGSDDWHLKGLTEGEIFINNNSLDPTIFILCNDNKIRRIGINGGGANVYLITTDDDTEPSDFNVYSALRALKTFLNKEKEDYTNFKLGLNGGATFGDFIQGYLGSGAKIDEEGRGEMQSLTLREFLEAPELRFNRIDVVSGELWNSIAFGTIESVDTKNKTATLKLEEGELMGIHVNDFCRGIFHNLVNNPTEGGIDNAGFEVIPGFSTSYFTPTELLEDGKSFKYELKPGTTVHPSPCMKFSVYGNPIDKSRQASAYSTRTYQRYLYNVNTWNITNRNIAMQFGDLSNLVINGENLEGYSAYLNNVYFTGKIEFTDAIKDEIKGQDAYSVTLSTYSAVYNVADGIYREVDVVTGDKSVTTGSDYVIASEFSISTIIQAFKGKDRLRYSNTVGEGKYVVSSESKGCKFVLSDGLIVVKEVTEDLATINLEVNCEGLSVHKLSFTIVRVADGRDGKDYEFIFTRTEKYEAPETPDSIQEDDYVPDGWTDDAIGPDETIPYEWVSKRTKINDIWGEFNTPSLWAKYSFDGEQGSSAKLVYITGDQVFKYPNPDFTGTPTPSSITLTATTQGIKEPVYKWHKKGSLQSLGSSSTLAVTPSMFDGNNLLTIVCTVTDTVGSYEDEFTLAKLANGSDGYTVLLSNEYISVPCDHNGNPLNEVSSVAYTYIYVFKGANSVDVTSCTISNPSGGSAIFDNTHDLVIVNSISNDINKFDLSIVADGVTFNKTLTVNKAKDGRPGTEGLPSIVAILTNEFHSFPAKENGEITDYRGANTTIKLYKGDTEITTGLSYTFYPSEGVTCKATGATFTISGMTVDSGYVDCTVVYNQRSYTKRFSLSKNKQGEGGTSYWIFSNANVVLKKGDFKPSILIFYPRKRIGDSTITAPVDCRLYVWGIKSDETAVTLIDGVFATNTEYSITVSADYVRYKAQLKKDETLLDELSVVITEDAEAAKDDLVKSLGDFASFEDYKQYVQENGHLYQSNGYINVNLIEAEAITSKIIYTEDFYSEVGKISNTEFTDKGAVLTGSVDSKETNLTLSPYPVPALNEMTNSSGSLNANVEIASKTETWTGAGKTYTYKSDTVSIPSGSSALNYSSLSVSGTYSAIVNDVEEAGTQRDRRISIRAYIEIFEGSSYISNFIGGVSNSSTFIDVPVSGTIPGGSIPLSNAATAVRLSVQIQGVIILPLDKTARHTLTLNRISQPNYFRTAINALKSSLGVDGYGIALDSKNYFHWKATGGALTMNFKGKVGSKSHLPGILLACDISLPASSGSGKLTIENASGLLIESAEISFSYTSTGDVTVTHNFGGYNYQVMPHGWFWNWDSQENVVMLGDKNLNDFKLRCFKRNSNGQLMPLGGAGLMVQILMISI